MQVPPEPVTPSFGKTEDEFAKVEALGLIASPAVSAGVVSNLQLLDQHFEIVSRALDDLGSTTK